jgi:predicted protein tyrosine phosphatase
MIHVCSLARLHATVDETSARHIVTLLRMTDIVQRPSHIDESNHLILSMDDVWAYQEGMVMPGERHVERLIDFATRWDRSAPMVVHCYAGISRSTAAAFTAACALNPNRDEREIATAIRSASRTAKPNALIVSIADKLLKRDGRMIRALEALGPGQDAEEGIPFRLDLA